MPTNEQLDQIIGFKHAVIEILKYLSANHDKLVSKTHPVYVLEDITNFLSKLRPDYE